ncbi:MAG: adenylate/guanylate cyclase domain-containing protein [Dongiaceae bacterium]
MARFGVAASWRLSIRLALILLVGLSCIAAAALVHGSWQRTANRNARDLVEQINDRITASVAGDLSGLIANAEATQAALRTIFFQDVIKIDNEAKREFVFLSMLQSQPSLSWVAFGWPDGSFFGARKDADDNIRMVEVRQHNPVMPGAFRIDYYQTVTGDIQFLNRELAPSSYMATAQPWYRGALDADKPVWSEVADFPTGRMPGIAISDRLEVYGHFLGVMTVTIDLSRLAKFLADLPVTRQGRAFLLAPGYRILSGDMSAAGNTAHGRHDWGNLSMGADPLVNAIAAGLQQDKIDLDAVSGEHRVTVHDAAAGRDYDVNIAPLPFRHWSVATVIPAEDILGDIPAATRQLYMFVIVLVGAILLVAAFAADRLISRPIAGIARQMDEIGRFHLSKLDLRPSRLRELDDLARALKQMAAGLGSFRKYLPADLVETLVARGIEAKPGGQRQQLSVLFTDLADSTALTEAEPERMVQILGRHLDTMSQAIHGEGGTVDKFIGDSVMAFWNAPTPYPDHALAACRAALACLARFAEDGEELQRISAGKAGLRIGINSGPALVGNVGSGNRLNYTAIGDTVNVASRLESLNKQYGTAILIGEATAAAAGEGVVLRRLDRVAVYGRQGGQDVFELIALRHGAGLNGSGEFSWIAAYEQGLDAYRRSDWDDAIACFHEADRLRGGDPAAQVMMKRCQAFLAAPPPADWDGTAVSAMK